MSAPRASYRTSPIKRSRRTKAEMAELRAGLFQIVEADQPMTVRQVFYQASVADLVEKTEGEYNATVARLLLEMRRAGVIPYHWISDNTRWQRKPRTYRGLADFIEGHQRAYRRDLWASADDYLEIWLEKEALAGVVYDVTAEYDVPLMVSRGFASESYLYSAADAITDELCSKLDLGVVGAKDRAFVYYFGDYDPSGLHISNQIERGLRRLCAELTRGFEPEILVFERVAVTEEQIEPWNLPTRPTKKQGNSHANGWPDGRPSVELDAFSATDLRNIVRNCIEQHVDQGELDHLRKVEAAEREQLAMFGRQVAGEAAP
jgi:hypothetical protein